MTGPPYDPGAGPPVRPGSHASSPEIAVEAWQPELEQVRAAVHIDVDCARIARQLKHSSRRNIGILPASTDTDVRPFTHQLALALSMLCQATIVIVDPDLRWPVDRSVADPVADAVIADDDTTFFSVRYVDTAMALVSPHETAPPGAKVELMQILLQRLDTAPADIAIVLIDLSGFDRIGEFLGAMDLLDGVVTVGRAGKTREDALLRLAALVSEELDLGVILTD